MVDTATQTGLETLTAEAIALLKSLIQTPSFSREEDRTADLIGNYLKTKHIHIHRKGNNVWAYSAHFDPAKPVLLLNSHHDTVRPNQGFTRDPFAATVVGDRLFGLGSNDAGGCLVSLIATFVHYNELAQQSATALAFNVVLAATAEEEISGPRGVESILADLGRIDLAIVGEPTQTQLAVAEKGLLVIDCTAQGRAGHAARNEGENAIYKALADIEWFRQYQFPEVSDMLGPVKMTVTVINAGSQHNVVPDTCTFTVDIRTTDVYRNAEVLDIIRQHVSCEVRERSFRLNASSIPLTHPIVLRGQALGRTCYASPTTSDQALMPFTSIKIGPGDSARSHTADEYIYLSEIRQGIEFYVQLLDGLVI